MTNASQKKSVLNIEPAYEDADSFYAALVESVDAIGDELAPQFLARLALILSNQVGSQDILLEAIEAARADLRS